jgi:transcriptional regulator with XRE-family HTH domain
MSELSLDFGRTLRRLRQANPPHLSQSKLADQAGLDHSYVSRLEAGQRRPSRDAVVILASVLQLNDHDRAQLFHAAGFAPDDAAIILGCGAPNAILEMVRRIKADAEAVLAAIDTGLLRGPEDLA